MRRASWTASSSDELTLLRRGDAGPATSVADPASAVVLQIGTGTALTSIVKSSDELTAQGLELRMDWVFQASREVFPWMFLRLTPREQGKVIMIARGLCAPEAPAGRFQETWRLTSAQIPEGRYSVEALFVDNAKRIWAAKTAQRDVPTTLLAPAVPLGDLRVTAQKDLPRK